MTEKYSSTFTRDELLKRARVTEMEFNSAVDEVQNVAGLIRESWQGRELHKAKDYLRELKNSVGKLEKLLGKF